MAYLPRNNIIWDGALFHVTWKCHNHHFLIRYSWAKQLYYELLVRYKEKYPVSFYSYHLMDNHIHLSGKIEGTREEFSSLFRIVNSLLARTINKKLKRRGQVILDRFRSPVIQNHQTLVNVMHYHDLNSYRAGMVKHPRDYLWSSYGYYAEGKVDALVTPAPCYTELADTDEKRRAAYRQRIEEIIKEDGRKKKDYSKTLYLGDPSWVKERYREIQRIKQLKKEAYRIRQARFYAQLSAGP